MSGADVKIKNWGGVVRQEKLWEVLSKVRGAKLCKEK